MMLDPATLGKAPASFMRPCRMRTTRSRSWLPPSLTSLVSLACAAILIPASVSAVPAPAAAGNVEMFAGTLLTPDTWKENVDNGIWLVEHFSPYCHHCKDFAPTWLELVETRKSSAEAINFHFGQVDCSVQGDLCDTNKVRGYPSIHLYENGEFVETFRKDRTLERLNKWLDDRLPDAPAATSSAKTDTVQQEAAKPAAPASVEGADPQDSANLAATDKSAEHSGAVETATEKQNVPILQDQSHHNNYKRVHANPDGKVVHANAAQLAQLLHPDGPNGPVFVKYYAPWCGHCKRLAPVWDKLAAVLRDKVNVVEFNCDDGANKPRCRSAGIKGYPTLMFYNGAESVEYPGSRALPDMEAFAIKASATGSPLRQVDARELAQIVKDENVVFLYLHPSNTPDSEVESVRDASRALLASAPIVSSSDAALFDKLKVPANSPQLLVFKNHKEFPASGLDMSAHATSTDSDPKEERSKHIANVVQWIHGNRYPILAELTAGNYKDYTEDGQIKRESFIVLAAISQERLGADATGKWKAELEKISTAWQEGLRFTPRDKPAHFVWVDADKWAKWLHQHYGSKNDAREPSVIIANPTREQYYSVDPKKGKLGIDGRQLFTTLEAVYNGDLKPQTTVSWGDRAGRAVFARMEPTLSWVAHHPFLSSILIILLIIIVVSVMIVLIDPEESPRSISGSSPFPPKYVPSANSLYSPAPAAGVKKD